MRIDGDRLQCSISRLDELLRLALDFASGAIGQLPAGATDIDSLPHWGLNKHGASGVTGLPGVVLHFQCGPRRIEHESLSYELAPPRCARLAAPEHVHSDCPLPI